MRHTFLLILVAILSFLPDSSVGQDLRIVGYNLFDKPVNSTQSADLRAIIGAIGDQSVFGNSLPIDVLAFQEGPLSTSAYAFVEIDFETVFGGNYEVFYASPDSSGDRTGVVYNAGRLNLINAQSITNLGFTHPPTLATFRPFDGTAEDEFSVISVHLKAGTTTSDANRRAAETNALGIVVDTLPAGANFIIVGDFNMKGSDESAWSGLIAAGTMESINAPFGLRISHWNDNLAFQPFHTQESGGFFGGMDDRFDMQLISDATMDDTGFEYVRGSLTAFGNNGTHSMNDGIMTGNGGGSVQGNLIDFSDHLPVVSDYRYGVTEEPADSLLNVVTSANYTIQPSGPRTGTSGTSFFNIEGDGNGNFASFGVVDFDMNGVLASGSVASNIKNIGIELLQANAGFTENGPYSVYIASATAAQVTIDSSVMYQAGNNGIACVPNVLSTNSVLLAKYPGVHYGPSGGGLPDGTIDDIALYGPEFEIGLLAALNTKGILRLIIVPELDETAATFAGHTNAMWAGPTIFGDYVTDVQADPVAVVGESFTVTRGDFVFGTVAALAESDNDDVSLSRRGSDTQSRTEMIIKSTSPYETPSIIEITLEGSVFARSTVVQTIELFDYDSATWQQIDSRNANRFSDGVATVILDGDVGRFVQPATNRIEARLLYKSLNPRQRFSSNTDQFQWTITP